jgi:hypothetical protein
MLIEKHAVIVPVTCVFCAFPPSETKLISLVAYLATLIQIEIGLNGVPKAITPATVSEIRSFRKFSFGINNKKRGREEN